MSEAPELPPRPLPPRGVVAIVGEWLRWIGTARLIASAVSVLIVVGGAWWLLRAPAPPTEASIPIAQASLPSITLPPPAASAPIATSSPVPTVLTVHVAGAVARSGVYRLDPSARVIDAVTAAGGPLADADLDALNLAAQLADGERVYVPHAGEIDPADVPSGAPVPAGQPDAASDRGPVDINTATADDLESLPGIGPATAAAIVDDRTRNGPFASVDDLERVPGIGPAKLAALRDQVTV